MTMIVGNHDGIPDLLEASKITTHDRTRLRQLAILA